MQASLFINEISEPIKSLKELRNEAIRSEFNLMTKKKYLDSEYVIAQLSKKYYISEETIWKIISGTGYYKNT